MAEQIVQEIHSQIQSKKKILAAPPQEDAPEVGITNIRMPTPPSYKVGDKVRSRASLFCSGALRLGQHGPQEGWASGERPRGVALPFPAWGQPALALFTVGAPRARDLPSHTASYRLRWDPGPPGSPVSGPSGPRLSSGHPVSGLAKARQACPPRRSPL